MKKVLIALDYDPSAEKIAETGFALAKSMGAETILLHVVADAVYYSSRSYSPIMGFTGYMETGLQESGKVDDLVKASAHFLDQSKQHLADANIKTLVKEGDFAETILATAKDLDADVIVVGSHSQKWLDEILAGSVTKKLLHHTTIPLFIIPVK